MSRSGAAMASTKSVLVEPSATPGGGRAKANDDARASASEQTIARVVSQGVFFRRGVDDDLDVRHHV